MKNDMPKFFRINFVKGVAATAIVVAAMGFLGACCTTASAENTDVTYAEVKVETNGGKMTKATPEKVDKLVETTTHAEEAVLKADEKTNIDETISEGITGEDAQGGTKENGAADNSDTLRPEEYTINDFPVIYQMPQLPTGCEITALTMVLNYYGFQADKVEMASVYLPTLASKETYYGADGRLYGNDMNQYFIGNPTGNGIICGTGAIITAANSFLNDNGNTMKAVDRTGATLEELFQMVSEGSPVVVWMTIGMQERIPMEGWYTESGEYVDWATNDHGAVLVGYTLNTVLIADPISGLIEYDSVQFEKVFASRSNQCVVLLQEIDT